MYYSSFGMMSLALFIITNYKVLWKSKDEEFSDAKNKYRVFMFAVIVYFITDILWGILYDTQIIPLVYADTVIYFAVMAATVMLWAEYVVTYLEKKSLFSSVLKYWGRVVFLFASICLVINLFTPLMFTFDENGVFEALPLRYMDYASKILFFSATGIYTFIAALKSSGKLRSRYITVAVSGITMTVFMVLQTLMPLFPFYSIGCLFASAFVHTFIELELEKDRRNILKDALESAESANAARTLFLSGMSHEIRTPINTIMGMTEMIRRECTDENVIKYVDDIDNAGSRLLAMISDILDFSKMESGKMEIMNEDYALADLVGNLQSLIQNRAEEKGLALAFDVDPGLPQRLYGDILKMKQVLTNILSNAVKYTEKGSVIFRVTQLDREDDRVKLRFVVMDTGIGIKEEDRDKLFHAFNRLDTQRNCSIEGTGLGLTIASDILQLMGSQLCVDSTYNVGSTFYFDIIQRIADDTPIDTSWKKEELQGDAEGSGILFFTSPESRILIVDDTELNLRVISGLLKPLKLQIDTASSGEECIEKFMDNTYDIVFLDYLMPKMDGKETLRRLKETYPGKTAYTPIISLTASAVTGVREEMLAAGFTDFMTKPVTLPYITNILIKYLPKSHIHTEQEQAEAVESASMAASPLEPSNLDEIPKALFEIPWLNVKEAVEYCGAADIFLGAIEIFTGGIDEKAALMENCVETGDIELFTVTVHALKSSSLTLGIDGLSAKAKELEALGKQKDVEKIREKLPVFLEEYKAVKPVLLQAMGK